jgi:hypothetical protein
MGAKKQVDTDAVLQNWGACNDYLRDATEDEAKALLTVEQKGKRRVQYVLRIHARYNSQRAKRERAELLAATK